VQLEKPKFYPTIQSFLLMLTLLLLLLAIRLIVIYHSYQDFIDKPFYYTYAKVLAAYDKQSAQRVYTVLKLKSTEGLTFYTATYKRGDFRHKRLRVQLFANTKISFLDYMGTFYIKSRIKKEELLPVTLKQKLFKAVDSQHQSSTLASFYNAIFFAAPLEKSLREAISKLGASHLVALSGFHLGMLWGLLYGGLLLFYKPIQQKFFPYRYALLDVGFTAMVLLGLYVWFVDFPPSLLRSYAMVLLGWFVLLLGMQLLSFTFLTTVILILLVLFPTMLVSVSFWLSVSGVFYIFLILRYTEAFHTIVVSIVFIPFGLFVFMLPVVHTVFGVTSIYQLLSPLLSILFVVFYPLEMLLHLLGLGGMLDDALLWLFSLPSESTEHLLPWWATALYIAVSITAVWYRVAFYMIFGFSILYGIYLFV